MFLVQSQGLHFKECPFVLKVSTSDKYFLYFCELLKLLLEQKVSKQIVLMKRFAVRILLIPRVPKLVAIFENVAFIFCGSDFILYNGHSHALYFTQVLQCKISIQECFTILE